MILSFDVPPMLVAGATAKPMCMFQRRRARIRERNTRDIGHHRLGGIARQHALEVLLGQAVLALVEEGPGQLQPHAHQTGLIDEHGAKGGDRLIQQRFPVGCPDSPQLPRPLDGRQPDKEKDVLATRVGLRQRPQDCQCLLEPLAFPK